MEPKIHSEEAPSNPPPSPPILHRECLKNHAAAIGGHALDGCCEFMPSPSSSLRCAACSCHRNFHRRLSFPSFPSNQIPISIPIPIPPSPFSSSAPQTLLALSRSQKPSPATTKKRHRTKFSAEQKGRMLELSERLGWRLQKRDEALVDDCCREIGVGKGVFKVWMHNNKYQLLGALRREGADADGRVAEGNGGLCAGEVDGNVMNDGSSSSC